MTPTRHTFRPVTAHRGAGIFIGCAAASPFLTSQERDATLIGRPTDYTPEIANRVCDALLTGRTLRDVCRDADMPAESTVRTWVQANRDGFAARYRRAREVGYHAMADEMLEIADDARGDFVPRKTRSGDGDMTVDHEHISRARLRVETRRWLMAKALPKVFGEKLDLKATHEAGDSLAELMKAIDGRTRGLPGG